MNRNSIFSILFIVLTVSANLSIAADTPKFKNEFPTGLGFNPKDKVDINLANYVQSTFKVSAKAVPEGSVDVRINNVFFSDSPPQSTGMYGLDCSHVVQNTVDYSYILLCGSSGMNVASFSYNKNNLRVEFEDQQISNIRQFSALSNEKLTKCSNISVGNTWEDSTMIYIVCQGLGSDASFESRVETQLYIVVVTNVTGTNQLNYVSHSQIDMSENPLGSELDIYTQYDSKQNEDIITISTNDNGKGLPDYNGYTIRFNASERKFTSDEATYISNANGNIKNFPISAPSNDQVRSLHSIFEGKDQIYMVIMEYDFGPVPSSGSSGSAPSGELSQEPVPKDTTSYLIAPCGLPKIIDEEKKTIGLECLDATPFLTKTGDRNIPMHFTSTDEHSLSDKGKGVDIVSFYQGAINAFNLVIENDQVTISGFVQCNDSNLQSFVNPKFAYVLDRKIYVGGITQIQPTSEGLTQEPADKTSVAAYYIDNQALTDIYDISNNGDGGLVFIRNDFYSGEVHNMFFINKVQGEFSVQRLNMWTATITNIAPESENALPGQTDVKITFSIQNDKQEAIATKDFQFTYTNKVTGIYKSNIGSSRFSRLYTSGVSQVPSFKNDFLGNNLQVKGEKFTLKTQGGKTVDAKVITKYTAQSVVEMKNSEGFPGFKNIKDSFYLGDVEYVFNDGEQGLITYLCGNFAETSAEEKLQCYQGYNIPKEKYAPTSSTRQYSLIAAERTDKWYIFLMRDDNPEQGAQGKHGILVFASIDDDEEKRQVKSIYLQKNYLDAAIRVKNNYLAIYLVIGQDEDLGNGQLWVGELNLGKMQEPTEPIFNKVKDVFNNSQLCPTQVEFMPHTDKIALLSNCPSDNGIVAQRIFEFSIPKRSEQPIASGYNYDNLNSVNNHDLKFRKPRFCLTENRIHVFETYEKKQEELQQIPGGSVMETIASSDAGSFRYYVPIGEVESKYSAHIDRVTSFHCDVDTNIVLAATNIKIDATTMFNIVTVINTNYMDEPSRRIHSLQAMPISKGSDIFTGIIGGNIGDDDEAMIMAYNPSSTTLTGVSAYMDGPHFYVYTEGDDEPIAQDTTMKIQFLNDEAGGISSTVNLNYMRPILSGKPTIKKGKDVLAIDTLTEKTAKIDLSDLIDFGDVPILDLTFKRNYEGKDGKTTDYPITPISQPVTDNWNNLTGDFDFFQQLGDRAVVYKNNRNDGQFTSSITMYQGPSEAKPVEVFSVTQFEKVETAHLFKFKDVSMVAALVRDDGIYKVAFMFMDPQIGEKPKLTIKIVSDPFGETLPEGIFKAHFKHQDSVSEENNTVVSMVAASNSNTPRVIVANFIFNKTFDASTWGVTTAFFKNIISDFDVSYANDVSTQTSDRKTGGYVVVVNDASEDFTILALELKDNSTQLETGGLFIVGRQSVHNSVKGETINHKMSKISCTRNLNDLATPGLNEYIQSCLLVSTSVSSPEINILLSPVHLIENMTSEFANLEYVRSLINFPGFYPVNVQRELNNAVIVWTRNQLVPASEKEFLKEDFLVAVYSINQGNQATKLYTPTDLGADSQRSEEVLIYITANTKIEGHFNVYINAPTAVQDEIHNNTKLFRKPRILQAGETRKATGVDMAQGYVWDLTKSLTADDSVSPTVDKFGVFTMESPKTASYIGLGDFVSNKDDPFNPEPGPKPKDKDGNMILYIIIGVLGFIVIAGAIFFFMKREGGDDDYEGEEDLEVEQKMEVDDEKTQTESEYSRL